MVNPRSPGKNISKRKELPEIDKQFLTLFQNMVRGVVLGRMIYDNNRRGLDFIFLMVNEAFVRFTGITNDLTGKRLSEVIPDISREEQKLIRLFGAVAITGARKRFEIYSDRFRIWYDVAFYSPEKEYFYVTIDIISQSKRTFEELRESEERYRAIFNTALVGIGIFDVEGNVQFYNERSIRDLGIDKDKLSGRTFPEILGEYGRIYHERIISVARGNGDLSFTELYKGPKGDRWFNTTYTAIRNPSGKITGVQVLSVDITEYRKAEEEIRNINDKLARAQRIAQIGNWERDMVTGKITWSDEMYRIYGLPLHSTITLETVLQQFPPEERERFNKMFRETVEKNVPYSHDYRIVRPDGSGRYIHTEGSVIRDQNGKAVLIYGTTQDITQQKKMQKALEESEKKYRQLVELAPDAVFVNQGNKILFANSAALKLSGCDSMEELMQIPAFEFVHPDEREQAITRSIKAIKTQKLDNFVERTFIRKNGEIIPVEVAVQPLLFDEKETLQVIIRDISSRKMAEKKIREFTGQLRAMADHHEKLRENERLKLAREIHDILGVSLSGIKMNLQVLRKSMKNVIDQQPGIKDQIDYMMSITGDTINSMRNMIYGLRPGILDELGFVEAVRWYAGDMQTRTGLNFKVKVTPEEMWVDPEKAIVLFRIFQEILANILKHAKATSVAVEIKKEGKAICLKVKDNGIGIKKKDLEKKGSFGILGIKERMIILNGKVSFKGTSSGTTVEIELPVK